jgi:1,4-alpha-glucan branching enzyme
MAGDSWQQFANARAFLACMYGHPGKKLLFMGSEIGQWNEWSHDAGVEWDLLRFDPHAGLQRCVADLNRLYRQQPALWEVDFDWNGFEWIDFQDAASCVIAFLRRAADREDFLVFACNFTPVVRHGYRVGVPAGGAYREIFNSDSAVYGGSDAGNLGSVEAQPRSCHGRDYSVSITLPPLAVVVFKPGGRVEIDGPADSPAV